MWACAGWEQAHCHSASCQLGALAGTPAAGRAPRKAPEPLSQKHRQEGQDRLGDRAISSRPRLSAPVSGVGDRSGRCSAGVQAPQALPGPARPQGKVSGHVGLRHLPWQRGAAEVPPGQRGTKRGTSQFSCPGAVVTGTRRLRGGIVLSGREIVEAWPHSRPTRGGGREGVGGCRGPGSQAPPQLAALSMGAGPRQPCLHPNNVPSVPSVQRPRPGTRYLVFLSLPRGLPVTPHPQRDTPWDLGTKGQGFLTQAAPLPHAPCQPACSSLVSPPGVSVKGTG